MQRGTGSGTPACSYVEGSPGWLTEAGEADCGKTAAAPQLWQPIYAAVYNNHYCEHVDDEAASCSNHLQLQKGPRVRGSRGQGRRTGDRKATLPASTSSSCCRQQLFLIPQSEME